MKRCSGFMKDVAIFKPSPPLSVAFVVRPRRPEQEQLTYTLPMLMLRIQNRMVPVQEDRACEPLSTLHSHW